MTIRPIDDKEKEAFDSVATHPLQSFAWGEFRKKTGVKVLRRGIYEREKLVDGFQVTIHKIPHTSYTIGYVPKGTLPTSIQIEELQKIGKEEKCVFIQLEPNIEDGSKFKVQSLKLGLRPSAHPLFTKENFVLDISLSEEDLLKNMHPKTRYNIRVAQKRGVIVKEDDSENAFEKYLQLTEETTSRQGFYAHTKQYHRNMWQTLRQTTRSERRATNDLSAHLFTATYENQTLVTWILFDFHDTLYYPYGASSNFHREVMASNLMMFEAIRFGKKMSMKYLDMWGALGENPDKHDPWYGFHRFKEGYGPRHVTYVGSFDLIINPFMYELYKITDKIRWQLLKLKKSFKK